MRRTAVGIPHLFRPSVQHALGPLCMTCGRVVDSEEIVEGYPGEKTFCKVLVKHHGAEELRTFDFASTNWDEQDLASMLRRHHWFDPHSVDEVGKDEVRPDAEYLMREDE